ncbi:MAG: GGDEF domain-containing protein [Fibrobacterales bacterium]
MMKELLRRFCNQGNARGFILVFSFSAFLFQIGLAAYIYRHYVIHSEEDASQLFEVGQIQKAIEERFYHIGSDLRYLVKIDLTPFIFSDTRNTLVKASLTSLASSIMERYSYDQIRWIDTSGQEVLRINYDSDLNTPYRVPDSLLQNKRTRYYVTETFEAAGKIFISPIDLNVEHDVVEKPIKPMIRIAKAVVDKAGNTLGMVILNYRMNDLLHTLDELNAHEGDQLLLLNLDGYYLKGLNRAHEFRFMYPDLEQVTFSTDNPELWKHVLTSDSIISHKSGNWYIKKIFPYKGVEFASIDKRWYLYLVMHKPEKMVHKLDYSLLMTLAGSGGILLPLLMFLGWKLGKYQARELAHLAKLKREATLDDFTGVYNRRGGNKKLADLFDIFQRIKGRFAIAFVDINNLKYTNDVLGHEEGDLLIKGVALILNQRQRKIDFVTRLGGDEFLVVFIDCGEGDAIRIMSTIQEQIIDLGRIRERDWSISFGCVENKGYTAVDDIIREADIRMYQFKQQYKATEGRNK